MSAEPDLTGDVLLRPVRPGNAFEDTVERLLQTIRLGIIAPGGSLPPERELAQRLAVSRDTVRDAIKALADAGYLVARRGRYGGTFVREELPPGGTPIGRSGGDAALDHEPPTAAELDDALRVREILEMGAVRLAARGTLTAVERDRLWSRMADVKQAAPEDYRRLDSRLHLTIGELVGAPSLTTLLAENRMRLNAYLDDIPLLTRNIEHSNEQHEAIVIAILAGDPEGAATTMEEHLRGSAALLHGFLA